MIPDAMLERTSAGSRSTAPVLRGRRRIIVVVGIAVLGLVLNTIVAAYMAPTTDERWHVDYGYLILRGDPDKTNVLLDSKMPVSALNAIPRAAGLYLEKHQRAPALASILRDPRTARWATVAAAFFLCLLVFVYAEALFGFAGGVFAELLFVMDPNVIAHSTLSTTDLYVAAAAVLALYCLRRFLLAPSTRNAVWLAVTLSAAQLTKFTAGYLYFTLVAVLFVAFLGARYDRENFPHISARQIAVLLALTAAGFFIFVNAGFLFDHPFTPLARFNFVSESFRRLQRVPLLNAVPLPVPRPFIQGMDGMSFHNSTGAHFGNMALLNHVRGPQLPRSDGFAAYYLVAYLVKEPLGMQILLVLGLYWTFRNRSFAELVAGEGLLLVAAGIFVLPLSLFSRSQVGIRHIIPAIVIFAILSGGAFQAWTRFSRRHKLVLAGCLLYIAVSVGSYYPHMIPYFNETLTDRRLAYRYLADSNLDWGQDMWVVNRFLQKNPDVILDPKERVSGRVLVRGDYLAGVWPRKADYFLRVDGVRPIAQVGYGHFLFDLPAQTPSKGDPQKRSQ